LHFLKFEFRSQSQTAFLLISLFESCHAAFDLCWTVTTVGCQETPTRTNPNSVIKEDTVTSGQVCRIRSKQAEVRQDELETQTKRVIVIME
jgi:hypothetical protein